MRRRQYTKEALVRAIEASATWQEVVYSLRGVSPKYAYLYIRRCALEFGLDISKLEAQIPNSGTKVKYTFDYLAPLVEKATTWSELCGFVGVQENEGNFKTLKAKMKSFGIDGQKFGSFYRKSTKNRRMTPLFDLLRYGVKVSSAHLRERLIRAGIKKRECEECGIDSWRGAPPPLELDHIDSNPLNNELENLMIRCSNCHGVETRRLRSEAALERKLGQIPERMFEDDLEADNEDSDLHQEELGDLAEIDD